MLTYRVCPHLPGVAPNVPGHPLYIGAQGSGRLDNPGHYQIWYLALDEAGAVGETFGHLDRWDDRMFDFPDIPSSRRVLATYRLEDHTPLLDLDDARNLSKRGLRPTQVIERNRAATQAWALDIYNERNDRGARMWQGVRWWSYHQPQWRIIGYWGNERPKFEDFEELNLTNPAVIDAAESLGRICKKRGAAIRAAVV
jgi:hypothetical protein